MQCLEYFGQNTARKYKRRERCEIIDQFIIQRNLKRGSMIGEGGDRMISSPGRSPKQPLPKIGLHDLQDGRQACPKFIAFDQGVGQICPR